MPSGIPLSGALRISLRTVVASFSFLASLFESVANAGVARSRAAAPAIKIFTDFICHLHPPFPLVARMRARRTRRLRSENSLELDTVERDHKISCGSRNIVRGS